MSSEDGLFPYFPKWRNCPYVGSIYIEIRSEDIKLIFVNLEDLFLIHMEFIELWGPWYIYESKLDIFGMTARFPVMPYYENLVSYEICNKIAISLKEKRWCGIYLFGNSRTVGLVINSNDSFFPLWEKYVEQFNLHERYGETSVPAWMLQN